MKIYKEIKVDLSKYINKVRDPEMDYTESERAKLNILYVDFEEGEFESAMKYAAGWSREELECIPQEIWEILVDVNMGQTYKTEEDFKAD
jgi:hypothetical protein